MAVTKGDALALVAERSNPEAVRLVADLMEQSTREMLSVERSLRASAERAEEEWKARALAAEARLARAEDRLMAIFD